MRRITLFMITFGLLGAFQPDAAKAQFLKSLTDNLKQTLQNRANGTHSVSGATAGSGTGGTAGGDGVSAQDSAAAIKAFMTASGGSGYYYETMITITSKRGNTKDTSLIDTALINSGSGDYQVTRVGTETVGGYSCVHPHLVNTIGSGAFKTTSIYDIWTSTAVPGYALFSKMLNLARSQGGIFGALAKADASGFLVLKLRLY